MSFRRIGSRRNVWANICRPKNVQGKVIFDQGQVKRRKVLEGSAIHRKECFQKIIFRSRATNDSFFRIFTVAEKSVIN
jgi:hypothetical protein